MLDSHPVDLSAEVEDRSVLRQKHRLLAIATQALAVRVRGGPDAEPIDLAVVAVDVVYPVGTFAAGSFVQNEDTLVTLARNSRTCVVNLFINGIASGSYSDTSGRYAPTSGTLYFVPDQSR